MYNMLIVDDNSRELEGISKNMDWNSIGVEVVGLCSDGQEALEFINNNHIDIVLTDIEMPRLTGIGLAKKLKETHPNIKIVFMSCHNDFDFAKQAIELDIYGYVLKPIMRQQLRQSIIKVLEIYHEETTESMERQELVKQMKETIPVMREQFIRELMYGNYKDTEVVNKKAKFLSLIPYSNYVLQAACILMLDDKLINSDSGEEYLKLYTIKKIIDTCCNENLCVFSVQMSDEKIVAVFFNSTSSSDQDEINIETFEALKEAINETTGINITIGVSNQSDKLIDLNILYNQAQKAAESKFYDRKNQIVLYDNIEEISEGFFEINYDLQELFTDVKKIVYDGETEKIAELIEKYFNYNQNMKSLSSVKSFVFSVVNSLQIVLLELNENFENVLNGESIVWNKLDKYESILDVKQWLYNLIAACSEHVKIKYSKAQFQLSNKIKDFIAQNYDKHLTVNDIAKFINFSASRANAIFLEQSGQTIFDYLSEYRIEVAKKMLKEADSKVYLVMQNVGYSNRANFNLQFKKYTNMLPVEYKNKYVKG